MIISLHTDQHIKDAVNIFGYAYGYNRICKHFDRFVYRNQKMTVVQNSPVAKVQMFYMEPEWYNLKTMTSFRPPNFVKFHDHQYKIYGTHLESTEVWPHWIDSMNKVDEIWTGNEFAAEAVRNSKVKTPVYVFEHGIDEGWTPKMRGKGSKIRFLHVDSGSPRKRADLVEKAFLSLFKGNMDVELTLKYHSHEYDGGYSVLDLFKEHKNVRRIYKTISQEEMVELFHSHDVLVYPSEGEGFGFIPLQALATGMPTISTGRWCSYEQYMPGNIIDSKLGRTTYTGYEYGDVVLADFDHLVSLMKNAYDNIDQQATFYYKQAPKVYKEYQWQNKCDTMLKGLIKRVGIDMLKPDESKRSPGKRPIYFQSGSAFCTASGVRFDSNNRIAEVLETEYDSLLSQPNFRELTGEEITKHRGY